MKRFLSELATLKQNRRFSAGSWNATNAAFSARITAFSLIAVCFCSSCLDASVFGSPAALDASSSRPDFGTVSVLTSTTTSVQLVNSGETVAKNLSVRGFSRPFSALGTQGTCGMSLSPAEACTLFFEFAPTAAGSFLETVQLSYDSGNEVKVLPLELTGTALPQGALDSTFGTGGITRISYGGDEIIRKLLTLPGDEIFALGDADSGPAGRRDVSLLKLGTGGALKTTFGTAGRVTVNATGASDSFVRGGVLQGDGKVVALVSAGTKMAAIRFRDDGTLDTSYGPGTGIVQFLQIGLSRDDPYDIVVDSAGRTVIVGESIVATMPVELSVGSLVRLDASGNPDLLFGALGGISTTFQIGAKNQPRAVGIQSTGSIVVAGSTGIGNAKDSAVIRASALTGAPDGTFNGNTGKLIYDYGSQSRSDEITDLAILPNNKILVSGVLTDAVHGDTEIFVARLNDDGTQDTSFGTEGDGSIVIDVSGNGDVSAELTVQSDGKILVAGYANNGTDDDFLLLRLESNGIRDALFQTLGVGSFAIGAGEDRAHAIALQSSGKILLGGSSIAGGSRDFIVTRHLP